MRRRAPVLVMLSSLALALPLSTLSAQSLEQAAARERGRREASGASPSSSFTDDDLRTYGAQRPPAATSRHFSEQPAGAADPPSAPDPLAHAPAQKQDALGRHWSSAEAYVRQCEQRLRAAESLLATGVVGIAGIATPASLAVDRAVRALERAKGYRDRAGLAVRLAAAPRASLPSSPSLSSGW